MNERTLDVYLGNLLARLIDAIKDREILLAENTILKEDLKDAREALAITKIALVEAEQLATKEWNAKADLQEELERFRNSEPVC